MELGLTPDVKINPFALPDTPQNRHFLHGFVKVLARRRGRGPLSEREDRDVVQADRRRSSPIPRELRRLDAISLPHATCSGGWRSGPKAGGSRCSTTSRTPSRSSSFQVLDLKAMSSIPEILQPMLFYALHRIRERIGHGFTQIYMDEAWRTITASGDLRVRAGDHQDRAAKERGAHSHHARAERLQDVRPPARRAPGSATRGCSVRTRASTGSSTRSGCT